MSAAGQLKEIIDNAVQAVTGEYERRIAELEDRVTALEGLAGPKAPARKTAPSVKARAQAAEGSGTAQAPGK